MKLNIFNICFEKTNYQSKPILYKGTLPLMITIIYSSIQIYKKSYKSQYAHLYSIKLLINYFHEILDIDLEKNIIRGNLKLITTKLPNFIIYMSNKCSNNNANNFNQHLSNIEMFIIWCDSFFNSNSFINTKNIQSIFITVHKTAYKNNTNYISLSEKDVLKILKLIKPNTSLNPFVKRNRVRNYSIVLLLMETGLRLGELLKIKTTDYIRDKDGIYLDIKDRNFDVEDSRKAKPQLKNIYGIRVIGVSFKTYELIDLYILKYRKKNKNHSYMFTSDVNGNPLSKGSVSNIFKIISNLLEIKFTPHILRHYFTEKMLEFLIETKGIEMDRAKDELRGICGWSVNSNMPNTYAKNYISKIASKHNLQRLENEKNNFTK